MAFIMNSSGYLSNFLQYLAKLSGSGNSRLPSLNELSKELRISVASLREQLEIARVLGFVEVKPKTGIKWLPYSFAPSILVSSAYAIEISSVYFDQYRDMRNHLEAVYFYEAVALLNPDDMQQLLKIINEAEKKIDGMPPKSPNIEHRDWHLMLFSHIDNVFVKGFLTVYWEIYQKQDYAFVSDSIYLRSVWSYHRKVTEQILVSDFSKAYQTFLEHKDLIKLSPKPVPNHKFE